MQRDAAANNLNMCLIRQLILGVDRVMVSRLLSINTGQPFPETKRPMVWSWCCELCTGLSDETHMQGQAAVFFFKYAKRREGPAHPQGLMLSWPSSQVSG